MLLAALTGCSGTGEPAGGLVGAHGGPALTATLVSPVDVELSWTGVEREASSAIVEFATEPDGRYTILEFVPPGRTTFRHPDLMPRTPFYYKVTPVLGPVSAPVDVDLSRPTAMAAKPKAAKQVVRPVREAGAAPSDVAVTSVADGARVTWSDNAQGEEGYLLEIRPAGRPDFRVAGYIDPDSTFVELSAMPGERKASYRVRAFYRGEASNLAHQTTGTA